MRFPAFRAKRAMKYFNQQRDVLFRSAARESQLEHIEPVKQIAPEGARCDGRVQVAIRSRDNPRVGSDR